MGSEVVRKQIFQSGRAPSLASTSLPMDVWNGSTGLYPFQAAPVTLYVSSSSASDVGKVLLIEGLNNDGIITRTPVVLNGQNQAAISGLWFRQWRAFNFGATAFVGTVYVAEQDTLSGGVPQTVSKIKMMISPACQQTQMCMFTVPKDYGARIYNIASAIIPKNTATAYASIGVFTRNKGGVFCIKGIIGLITSGTSNTQLTGLEFNDPILPMTDIVLRVIEISADGMEVSGGVGLKLITM